MNDVEDVIDVISAIQEGDFELVSLAIKEQHVTAAALDQEGCSLLHWAAINNRHDIAELLINQGAAINIAGGMLGETPLLWAIRKKYYRMMQLLIVKGADLSVKSVQGLDGLHMAVRAGDWNMLFMLLHYGADPNSTDKEGLTPILWLVKNGNRKGPITPKQGRALMKPIRFLLNFGGDVTLTDPETSDTALHVAASMKGFDQRVAFLLHEADKGIIVAKNKLEQTAWNVAGHSGNRPFSQFLLDALYHGVLPYHAVTSVGVLCVLSAYILLVIQGYLYGTLIWVASYYLIWRNLTQWSLVDHRGRNILGNLVGLYLVTLLSFRSDNMPFISFFSTLLCLTLGVFSGYSFYLVNKSKPQTAITKDRKDIVTLIVATSPFEGPESSSNSSNGNTSNHKIGEKIVNKGNKGGEKDTVRMCGVCLVDLNESRDSIHCQACGVCVLGLDGHYGFLGNCIGRGNRRLYLLFLLCSSLFLVCFSVLSLTNHSRGICMESAGPESKTFSQSIYYFISTEYCAAFSLPASFLLTWINLRLACHFITAFGLQLMLIVRQTTIHYAVRGVFNESRLSMKIIYKEMYEFCRYGTYVIYDEDDTFAGIQHNNKCYSNSGSSGNSHDKNHNDGHTGHYGDNGDSGSHGIRGSSGSSARKNNSHSNSYDSGHNHNDKYVVHNNKIEKNNSYDIRDGDNGYHNHHDDSNSSRHNIEKNSSNNNRNGRNSKNVKSNKMHNQEYYTKEFEYDNVEEGIRRNDHDQSYHFSDDEERGENSRQNNGQQECLLDGDDSEDSEDDYNGYKLHIQQRKNKIELKKNPIKKKCCDHDHSNAAPTLPSRRGSATHSHSIRMDER